MPLTRKTILLAIATALVLWIGGAAIDAIVFRTGTFTDILLFHLPAHEMYSRVLLIVSLIAIVAVFSLTVVTHDRTQKAFQESNETLLTIADAAKDAIVLLDQEGQISFWNRAAENIFGYASHEAIGTEIHALLAPERYRRPYQESFRRFRESGLDSTSGRMLEMRAVHSRGHEFPMEISLSALPLKGKWHAVGILRDITERKRTEAELLQHRERLEQLVRERTEELHTVNEVLSREILDRTRTEEELLRSENFLNTVFDSIHDPFSIVDRNYKIIKFNNAYAHQRNKRAGDLFGKKCFEVLHNQPDVCDDCIVDRTFQSKDPCAKEKQMMLPDGSIAWVEIFTYPVLDPAGQVSHVIEYTRDITDRKKEEEEKKQLIDRLNHLSMTDSLTGLFNRRALNDMLVHEIERANRYSTDLSLVLCDIDMFKTINDAHGHTAGDRALLSVAAILQQTLRKSDIVGRYGGDEFMVILPETSLAGAKKLAEKARLAVESLDIAFPGSARIKLTLSIGVASCCTPMDNIDTLVSLADKALYESKDAGRNKVSTKTR